MFNLNALSTNFPTTDNIILHKPLEYVVVHNNNLYTKNTKSIIAFFSLPIVISLSLLILNRMNYLGLENIEKPSFWSWWFLWVYDSYDKAIRMLKHRFKLNIHMI